MKTSDEFDKTWFIKRRIACDGYPPSEALYQDVYEYIESLEQELETERAEYAIADRAITRLRAEVDEISDALPGVRFMDPPDGGSPTIAEQVSRAIAALNKAEDENDRLRAEVADQKDAFNKLNEMLAESLEDRDRLRAEVAEKTRLLADKDGDIIDLQIERDRLRELLREAYWFIPKDAYLSEKIDAALKEGESKLSRAVKLARGGEAPPLPFNSGAERKEGS